MGRIITSLLLAGFAHAETGGDNDPKKFIRVVEHDRARRRVLYGPDSPSTQFTANQDAAIVIELIRDRVPAGTLDQLFITAELRHDRESQKVEVLGYSEVGKDQETTAAQRALAFRTLSDLQAAVENLFRTSRDVVRAIYGDACHDQITSTHDPAGGACVFDPNRAPQARQALTHFRDAEFKVLPRLFSNPRNAAAVSFVGNRIFGIDTASLQAVAARVEADAEAMADPTRAEAATRAFGERAKMILTDFHRDFATKKQRDAGLTEEGYIALARAALTEQLRGALVDGQINLARYKASEGDALIIRAEAKGADKSSSGAVVEFHCRLKAYGARRSIQPSLFLVRRVGVDERNQALRAVRFAPAPGVTLGVTYKDRADGLLHTLAPSLGMNVSFMNFDDPRDFDVARNQFTRTNGTNFQVGAGLTAGLFDNGVQVTYGWNLQAPAKSAYWGVGFGFLSLGERLAGFVKK